MAKQKKSLTNGQLLNLMPAAGRDLLAALGYETELPTHENPVWVALAGLHPSSDAELDALVGVGEMTESEAESLKAAASRGSELAGKLRPFLWNGASPNKAAVLAAYQICQIPCLNAGKGPIGDGSLGTIRQLWYYSKLPAAMGFKFAAQLLEYELIRTADVVLVDDQRARDRARDLRDDGGFIALSDADGQTHQLATVLYKTDWKKATQIGRERLLGHKPRVCTWPRQGWGRAYAQLQSQILVDLVRSGATYEGLWIRDASRTFKQQSPLLPDLHAVLLLEKEGLVDHFADFCRRVGIKLLVGMAGNNAFSVVEALLNESFRNWEGQLQPDEDNPLHILTLTDHDYFGHVPVEAGAVSQFEHYLSGAVVLHRAGIMPEQVRALGRSVVQAGYEFEADKNSATWAWATGRRCQVCGHEWSGEKEGQDYLWPTDYCPECYTDGEWDYIYGTWVGDTCYALEVEALAPSDYVPTIVDIIVEIVGGDEELRKRLAEAAEPNHWNVVNRIEGELYAKLELHHLLRRLEQFASGKRYRTEHEVNGWVEETVGRRDDPAGWFNDPDVREEINDIVADKAKEVDTKAFTEYVQEPVAYANAWAPLDAEDTEQAMQDRFLEDFEDEIDETVAGLDHRNYRLIWHLRAVLEELEKIDLV